MEKVTGIRRGLPVPSLRVDGGPRIRLVLGDPSQKSLAAVVTVGAVGPKLRTREPVRLSLLARGARARLHGHQRLSKTLAKG
jgi:hypothetical protein